MLAEEFRQTNIKGNIPSSPNAALRLDPESNKVFHEER